MQRDLTLETLAKGEGCGIRRRSQGVEVITNDQGWNKFLSEYTADGTPTPQTPPIHFGTHMVLVAYGGLKNDSGGHETEIRRVTYDNMQGTLAIEVYNNNVKGSHMTQAQPHHVVKVEKKGGQPIIKYV